MVRKIAELIHVPHLQFIKAKLKVQNRDLDPISLNRKLDDG